MNRYTRFLFFIVCLGMASCFAFSAAAQETQPGKDKDTLQTVMLSQDQLKAFEGVYQSAQNKEMNIQFRVVEHSLIAKMLWADREIRILPTADTAFVSQEILEGGHIPVKFVKNQRGVFTQVVIGNNDRWDRVKDYKPVVKTEIRHTPAQLKPFEGLYEIEGERGLFLQITEKDNQLVLLRYWNGGGEAYVPDSAAHFFFREQPMMTLRFIKDSTGKIAQLQALGSNMWYRREGPHFKGRELKSFEGKYKFKDDPDDIIRITSRDSGLVVRQLWDGKEIFLTAKSDAFFYAPAQTYSLHFTKDKSGVITQVLLLNEDVFEKIKE